MNIRENLNLQGNNSKLTGIALILQSMPLPLVYWLLTVLTLISAFMIYLFIAWLKIIAFTVVFSVVSYNLCKLAFDRYHYIKRQNAETQACIEQTRRLSVANETALAKLEVHKQLTDVLTYAVDAGHNVKYGGLEVSSWKSHISMLPQGDCKIEQIAAPEYVPDAFKFSDVLQNGFRPSKEGILLAKKEDLILCPTSEGLCHTTFTGNTDSGKTSDERLILIQLLYLRE